MKDRFVITNISMIIFAGGHIYNKYFYAKNMVSVDKIEIDMSS